MRPVEAGRQAGDLGAGRLDGRRHPGAGGGGVPAVDRQGGAHPLREPQQLQRLQGGRHVGGPQEGLRQGLRASGRLRRRLPARCQLPLAHRARPPVRPGGGAGAGPVAVHEHGRVHPHPHPGDVAGLPLLHGARGGVSVPRLLRLQRHGWGVARAGPGGRRGLEGPHHGGGHGPGREGVHVGLEVRLRRRRPGPQRAAQQLQGLPVPAAPVVMRGANLMRKMFWEIVASRQVSAWKKIHVLYGFFYVRKVVAHLVTFLFYCVVIPAYVLVGGQDVRLPKYVAMYVPAIITLLNAVCTPRSWHLLVFWILFENVMSMHRSKATIIGLVEASRANEWVITEKLGSATSTPTATTTMASNKGEMKKKKSQSSSSSFLAPEIVMGLCLLYCAVYEIVFGHDHFYVYLLMQSAAAFIIGFGYVGSQ